MENGRLTENALNDALSKISYSSELAKAVEYADLVSESVAENIELKREVHKQLDAVCPDGAILTTNTSSLLVSEIEDVVRRGDRFAAMHFHLGGSLIDIVRGPRTSAETIDILVRFARSLKQTPVVLKKEKDGYLYNTILLSMIKTAVLLVHDGYADYKDVDRAYMAATRGGVGPFGIIDSVGVNVCMDVFDAQGKRRPTEGFTEAAEILKPYVENGDLGMKAGKGFYSYPDPEFRSPEFLA